MTDITVDVPIKRKLLWELRQRYDEATIYDIAGIVYCTKRVMGYGMQMARIGFSLALVTAVAYHMPGSALLRWGPLLPVAALGVWALVRTYRASLPYERAGKALREKDSAKFERIAEEMLPVEKERVGPDDAEEMLKVTLRL